MTDYATYRNGRRVSTAKNLKTAEKVAKGIAKNTRGSATVEVFKVGAPTTVKDRSMKRVSAKGRW